MKTLLALTLIFLTSCTTNQPLNDKLLNVGFELVTFGLASQQAPTPPPTPTK